VENESLAASVANAKGSLGQALEEIIELLTERGYLQRDRLTPAGKMLARIWSESDLVVAECLRRGIWDGLAAADLAAVVSALVFESRREGQITPRAPSGSAAEALAATVRVWAEISARERAIGLPPTRDPDAGFAAAVAAWCKGNSLADAMAVAVAGGTDLSAGDFVRWCRQVIDLLDQVGTVAPDKVARAARSAVGSLRRGVVSMGSV
jgi:ATP-dependent RNA helicase HelY